MQRPWTKRELLVMLIVVWIGGTGLLVLAWYADNEDKRMRGAPRCTQAEEFTPARCVTVLDGALVELTSNFARVDVEGRQLTMSTIISHDVPPAGGRQVRVTLYRGKPVLIEADHLWVDSDDKPSDDRPIMLAGGGFLLVAGTAGVVRELRRTTRGG
ncbi:hypothetical protein [Dactylosporangium sp. NPDC005555]|uniref:hypothetical protein n=1 Tax=Dactylosporangium sp. NPDC005555 TaxID=3154889 RepID=UPI0033B61DEB